MAATTFGKRGLPRQISSPAPAFSRSVVLDTQRESDDTLEEENLFVARLPILTVGMIGLLMLIFGLEKKSAFEIDGGSLSHLSLLALGASGYDLVVGAGEFWRMALAPILHASASHFVGNSFALFFVGLRLEPMIGRAWFAALFVVSAIGGLAGSMIGNPHEIVTVGASGAITGLIGALFVVSFNHRSDEQDGRAMRMTALKFGVPALAPLAFGASGNTDYFCHLGGALAGAGVAFALAFVWAEDRLRPSFENVALGIAGLGLTASAAASLFAFHGFAAYRAKAAELIPAIERPKDWRTDEIHAATLVTRYPNDPLAHIIQAIAYDDKHRHYAAEVELRSAVDHADAGLQGKAMREVSTALLAIVLAEEGRTQEAKTMAAGFCVDKSGKVTKDMLRKAKLCS